MKDDKVTQPLYIVMHIRKNAGRTLKATFERNFRGAAWMPLDSGRDIKTIDNNWPQDTSLMDVQKIRDHVCQRATAQTRCLFGHEVFFGIHEMVGFGREPRYIAFLRHPVERCISRYYYQRGSNPANAWIKPILENDWSLEEWFENSPLVDKFNGQIRHLLLGSYPEVLTERELTREHLEEAKRRLRQFWFVGLTDCFDDDAYYLYGRLGFRRFDPRDVVNASRRDRAIPEASRRLIAAHNELDVELYEFARQLRQERMERLGPEFDDYKNKALKQRKLYNALVNAPLRVAYENPLNSLRSLVRTAKNK